MSRNGKECSPSLNRNVSPSSIGVYMCAIAGSSLSRWSWRYRSRPSSCFPSSWWWWSRCESFWLVRHLDRLGKLVMQVCLHFHYWLRRESGVFGAAGALLSIHPQLPLLQVSEKWEGKRERERVNDCPVKSSSVSHSLPILLSTL